MTSVPRKQAHKISINNAPQALEKGDKKEARSWARRVINQDPSQKEPWLILAEVSRPKQSASYPEKAGIINPRRHPKLKQTHRAGKKIGQTQKPKIKKHTVKQTKPSTQKKKTQWGIILFIALIFGGIGGLSWLGKKSVINQGGKRLAIQRPEGALVKPSITPLINLIPIDFTYPLFTATPESTFTPFPTSTPGRSFFNYYAHSWDIPDTEAGDSDFWIEVDLSDQMLFTYLGSTLTQSYSVSTGTSKHPTVTGIYKIYAMYPYYSMRGPGYNLPDVPFSMFFYKGFSIHGTYWHRNFGTPMSHGCVNMETSAAAQVYEQARIGTMVYIHY